MQSYKRYFSDKSFVVLFLGGVLLVAVSFVAQFYSSIYATYASSSPVTDIILSNTRVYDVDLIFVYGTILMTLLIISIGLIKINCAPFIMKAVAIFTLIRSIFVTLTHISPFPTHVLISSTFFTREFFNGIFTGGDLFFSGHTGMPFLLALMFWDNKILRFIFLGFSVLFAVVVLLGHLHYSIDVLSAYFITYGTFHICKFLFKKDWNLFFKKPVPY
jgi:membrane-associated phospholipid phosphatase